MLQWSRIGGSHENAETNNTVWEAWINDKPFTFRKIRQRGGAFLYSL
jgi:hypothetical protein